MSSIAGIEPDVCTILIESALYLRWNSPSHCSHLDTSYNIYTSPSTPVNLYLGIVDLTSGMYDTTRLIPATNIRTLRDQVSRITWAAVHITTFLWLDKKLPSRMMHTDFNPTFAFAGQDSFL